MATLNLQLANGNCDADEKEDDTDFDGTGNNIAMTANNGGAAYNGGFRFVGVTLIAADTVTACGVEPFVRASADDPDGAWYGHDVDDSTDFVTDADVTTRLSTKTTANVVVDDEGVVPGGDAFYEFTGLQAIINEILARGGWSSGNAITILWLASTIANSGFTARSHENNAAEACKLNITYTPAAAGGVRRLLNMSGGMQEMLGGMGG